MDPFTQEILFTLGVLLLGVLIGALYGYSSGHERGRDERRHRRALRNRASKVSREGVA